jgi:hypothetical protein
LQALVVETPVLLDADRKTAGHFRYHPVSEQGEAGYRLTVRGDGATAHVDVGPGQPPRRCDREEPRVVMLDLLDGKLR